MHHSRHGVSSKVRLLPMLQQHRDSFAVRNRRKLLSPQMVRRTRQCLRLISNHVGELQQHGKYQCFRLAWKEVHLCFLRPRAASPWGVAIHLRSWVTLRQWLPCASRFVMKVHRFGILSLLAREISKCSWRTPNINCDSTKLLETSLEASAIE